MSPVDWKMLESRRSCALLSRDEMEQGKVPTTPTTASVIAGIQCQEAVKLLHGNETLAGRGFVFEGTRHESYVVTYTRNDDCPSHEAHEPIETLSLRVSQTRVGDFLERVRADLGPRAVVEMNSDLLESLDCAACGESETVLTSLGAVTEAQARCPRCGEPRRPKMFHTVDGSESFLDRTLGQIGVPPWDILAGRSGLEQRFYEFAGDSHDVLGPLAARSSLV